jgi:cytidylate kinase
VIVNIRGTSGSGKTTVVRGLMSAASVEKVFADDTDDALFGQSKHPDAYALTMPDVSPTVFVIGSYENTCGGCDAIPKQDEICERVRRYASRGHVVMEGLLMSHLFGRYAALDRELQPTPYIWAFLDTPLDLCIERVKARRDARGVAKKEFNPHNTTAKWHDMRRVYAKCQAAGLDARWVDHRDPVREVLRWLVEAPACVS